jgi:hypothetical protein
MDRGVGGDKEKKNVYYSFRATQLYRSYILAFIVYYYMFRLSISAILRKDTRFAKRV